MDVNDTVVYLGFQSFRFCRDALPAQSQTGCRSPVRAVRAPNHLGWILALRTAAPCRGRGVSQPCRLRRYVQAA